MKREIQAFDYAETILKAIPKGVLLTTKADDKVNTMTIGWGTMGIQWGKPIFIVFVREHRHTWEMLEKNGNFTVNVPLEDAAKILSYCGTKSGRDTDKIADLGLTLVEPTVIDVPGIKELPLTLECKTIYKQAQNPDAINEENKTRYYHDDIPGDYHTAYYGQIVAAYIAE